MTKEETYRIERKTASQVVEIPPGPDASKRMLLAVEQAMNLEWWRGYWAAKAER